MNLLFICYENIVRSRTAATEFSKDKRYTCRSAGLGSESEVLLTGNMLEWADRIFVMEDELAGIIQQRFPSETRYRELIILDIYDDYHYMQPELVKAVREKVTPHLENE